MINEKKEIQIATGASILKDFQNRIKALLSKNFDKERYVRIAILELDKSDDLRKCTTFSLVGSILEAARLGLEVGTSKGEAYLIPYKNICKLIIGYRGMLALLQRSGKIKHAEAQAVYANDILEYQRGRNTDLKHIPRIKDRGEIIAFYSSVSTIDGGFFFEMMSKEEVDEIRNTSPAYKKDGKNSIWGTHYVAMGRKTLIRQLFKFLPLSSEIQMAAIIDEMGELPGNKQQDAIEAEFSEIKKEIDSAAQLENKSRSEQLADAL